MTREEYLGYLRGQYTHVEALPCGDRWVAWYPLMFHYTMITGHLDDHDGYDDRWCYGDRGLVEFALEEWRLREFQGEPTLWHRHPPTGRRRPDGDPAAEYVAH